MGGLMRKKLIVLLFLILGACVFSKDMGKIKSISALVEENTHYNNRKTYKKYRIKSIIPDKIRKEMLAPEINSGEVYVYRGSEKQIYYPILEQTVSQKIDKDENFIIKVIKDLENPEKLTILREDKLTKAISYNSGLEIKFQDYEKIGDYDFPKNIKVYDQESLISELSFKEVELDIDLCESEFQLNIK